MKGAQSEQKSSTVGQSQRGEENAPGQKSKGMSSQNEGGKAGKDTKAEGREKSTVGQSQRGEENAPGQKSKGMSSENETKGGKDTKAEGREGQKSKSTESERNKSSTVGQSPRSEENAPGQKQKGMSSEAETKGNKEMKGQEGRTGNMNAPGAEGRTQTQTQGERSQTTTTTGQAGAAAKLSTEQRTQITTVIRNEHVAPVNTVDFDISIGTRVPRERVSLRPLPSGVVTIYPEWRGYQFILVRNEILVVDPATFEIVAVLPA